MLEAQERTALRPPIGVRAVVDDEAVGLDHGLLEDGTLDGEARVLSAPSEPMLPVPLLVVVLLGGLGTLVLGSASPTLEVPVASVSEALQAFDGAAADLPPEQAVILHLSHAELLDLAGDPMAAAVRYAEVVSLDSEGPLGAQAKRALAER